MKFDELLKTIERLKNLRGVKTEIIGRSVLGRPIYAFRVGGAAGAGGVTPCKYGGSRKKCTSAPIIITGGIHAREWITALLVAEMATGATLGGDVYFVPLCNPDGAEIAIKTDPLWKSNARGVDLNVNFDADWGKGAKNVRAAGAENYIGLYPASEPETMALVNFTLRVKPRAVIAYHSKGEVVYYAQWGCDAQRVKGVAGNGCDPQRVKGSLKNLNAKTKRLAMRVAKSTGYAPERTKNSVGGYCDWVTMRLGVPAVTIEVGRDDLPHPITPEYLPEIIAQNAGVLRAVGATRSK